MSHPTPQGTRPSLDGASKAPATLGPLLPSGPVPSQEDTYRALNSLVRLHRFQVQSAADERPLVQPPHLWLTGPRGSGKSHLARNVATESGLPWIQADLSRYSTAGHPGRSLEMIVQELANKCSPAFGKDSAGIVIVEGLDRELSPASVGDRPRSLQAELAALLEGFDVPCRIQGTINLANSRRLMFILTFTTETTSARGRLGFGANLKPPSVTDTGSETGIQFLRDAGVTNSLLGLGLLRLPGLTPEDLEILVLRADGGLVSIHRLFADEGIGVAFTTDACRWISREAVAHARGGHGLARSLSVIAAQLAKLLPTLPACVESVRITSDFLEGSQPIEFIAGVRKPSRVLKAAAHATSPHPDFPRETLPHRPTRPANTGASSQGRLANLSDLNRWTQ